MKRIAIVGGGISGLATAFALEERRRAGESLEFVVYESGPRFGGVLATEQVGGFWVLEAANLDEALEWGRKATVACRAPVEVRPFH